MTSSGSYYIPDGFEDTDSSGNKYLSCKWESIGGEMFNHTECYATMRGSISEYASYEDDSTYYWKEYAFSYNLGEYTSADGYNADDYPSKDYANVDNWVYLWLASTTWRQMSITLWEKPEIFFRPLPSA